MMILHGVVDAPSCGPCWNANAVPHPCAFAAVVAEANAASSKVPVGVITKVRARFPPTNVFGVNVATVADWTLLIVLRDSRTDPLAGSIAYTVQPTVEPPLLRVVNRHPEQVT